MKRLLQLTLTIVTIVLLCPTLPVFYTQAADPLDEPSVEYPPNPLRDVAWQGAMSTVADIQAAFNAARQIEAQDLGIQLPTITLPSQAEWDSYSDGEKALWLMNRERSDRGIDPFHGLESNITGVAQYYADYLRTTNQTGHNADGRAPEERITDNATIGACIDFLPQVENLAYFWSTDPIPLPVERAAVYGWLYEDMSSEWGHRTAILQYPLNDNSGPTGREGFIGIGRSSGPMSYQGTAWPNAEVVVLNLFDPCASWNYGTEPEPVLSVSPTSLSFTANAGGPNPSDKGVEITNSGSGELQWQAAADEPWITVSDTSGNAPATLMIGIDVTGLPAGTYQGAVRIQSGQQSVDVSVTLTVQTVTPQSTTVYVPISMYPGISEPTILLADEFCNTDSGWPVSEVTDSYALGYLPLDCHYQIQITSDNHMAAATPGLSVSTYQIETNLYFASGTGAAGLLFGLNQEWSRFYLFSVATTGYYWLSYYENGNWIDIVPPTPSALISATDYNRIRVVSAGSTFTLYLRSTYLSSVDDLRDHTGRVGLYAEGLAGFDARFQNFIVWDR